LISKSTKSPVFLKGSSDPNHFSFEINVGKSRIRHGTTLNFERDLEIQFQSHSMSDPTLFDIDFKNKMARFGTTLNKFLRHHPNDGPEVEILEPVENCTRKTQTSDYIRYYGSGATMDGKVFWENSPDYTWDTYLGYGKLIPGMEKV